MLYRKRQKDIIDWINNKDNKALLITGARQIGKTYLIENTLKEEAEDFVVFNLIERPELVKTFETISYNGIDTFIERLTILTSHDFIPGKTIIFFDEIQEYKEIVTKIKFLINDGRFKYIFSGSLLGVELVNLKSIPVGYLDIIKMYPLDFYEFLKALNIKDETLDKLYECFLNKEAVDSFIHEKIIEAFRNYLIIGGMPEAVSSYVNYHDFNKIYKIHMNLVEQYKLDFTKYEKENKLKLRKIYEFIPVELADKNKRFKFIDIDPHFKFDRYENSFNWLIDAGVCIPVYNVNEPRMPLKINLKSNLFKLFLSDTGMLSSLYGKTCELAILNGDSSLNCGAIYENIVAQELFAHGFEGYFFNSHKQGELDFVIEYNDFVLPIEVKSGKDYTKHNALDNVLNNKDYKIKEAFVFSNANVEVKDSITYYPIYMIMFIDKDRSKQIELRKIDLSNI